MIPVFFNPAVTVELSDLPYPADKFKAIALDWKKRFPDIKLVKSDPASEKDLARVHDSDHVKAVLAGDIRNGYGTIKPVNALSSAYDVGSFVAAAEVAASRGINAASIGGNFGHAGYDRCHGFCSFNGFMVAAEVIRSKGFKGKIGIFDANQHFGDGTFDIITKLEMSGFVTHYSYGQQSLDESEVDEWLAEIPVLIEEMVQDGVGIVFYSAGADAHFQDPRSNGVMSLDQIRKRDQQVFATCKRLQVPVAWTSGPGNLPVGPLMQIHASAVLGCLGR